MNTIHLHGRLKRFGGPFRLDVETPAEAVRALCSMLPGFGQAVRAGSWRVIRGKRRGGMELDVESLEMRLGGEMHIAPALIGAKKGGTGKIIIGAVILAAAIIAAPAVVGALGPTLGMATPIVAAGGFSVTYTSVAMVGAALMLQGLSQMLAPTPKAGPEIDTRSSYLLGGTANVVEQGSPVPLVFGKIRTGSVIISSGTSVQRIGAPTENLRAKQTMRLVHLLSEGPIGGAIAKDDSAKSVIFGNTPWVAQDGTRNYNGVSVEWRGGWPNQEPLSGVAGQETTIPISGGMGVEVTVRNGPVVRRFDFTGYTRVKITVTIPSLYEMSKGGDVMHRRVYWRVEARPVGSTGGWSVLEQGTVGGRSLSPFPQESILPVPGSGEWDIRLVRETPDATPDTDGDSFGPDDIQNQTWWTNVVLISDRKIRYEHSALASMELDAEHFGSSMPPMLFDIEGMLLQVPANFDPISRTYASTGPGTSGGVWDGTFKLAWTDNPAWILYNLIVNERWGLGRALATNKVDKFAFYEIAAYCDQHVPNGFGGTEPRFSFNGCINQSDDAYRVLQAVASTFRGMLYWSNGMIVPVADMPKEPVKLLTPANVVDGRFEYESSSRRARHSVVKSQWRDPSVDYRNAIEIVQDAEMVADVGIREVTYTALGCTSRGLARRLARWVLFTEKHESEVVHYRTGLDNADARPGDIVLIQDPSVAGESLSGRIEAVPSGTQVRLDRPITAAPGRRYELRVTLADGTVSAPIPVAAFSGDVAVLGQALPAGNLPAPGDVWMLLVNDLKPRAFRVATVEEGDDGSYAFTAVSHDPSKYRYIEEGAPLDDVPFTNFPVPGGALPPPTNLFVREWMGGAGSTTVLRATCSWTGPTDPRVTAYEVQALRAGVIAEAATTRDYSHTFVGLGQDTYVFQVRSTGANGMVSPWVLSAPVLVDGTTEPPDAPVWVGATGITRGILLSWRLPETRLFRAIQVARSPSSAFSAATQIAEITGTSFLDSGLLPNQTFHYWIRTRDTLDHFSGWVGPVSATSTMLVADSIADGLVTTAKFAQGLSVVELVDALPVTGNFEGRLSYHKAQGKLYKYSGGAWVPLVSAVDIPDALTQEDIDDLDLARLGGQLTSDQIADLAATKITGQLSNAQLADIAASKIVGQLTNAQIAELAAAKLTGQITKTQITDGAIETPKLAAGAITTEKLAASAVTAEKLTVGASSNVIWNASMLLGTDGWIASATGTLSAGLTMGVEDTATGMGQGSRNGFVRSPGSTTANHYIQARWSPDGDAASATLPCQPGDRIQGSAFVQARNCRARILVEFINAAGAYISGGSAARLVGGDAGDPGYVTNNATADRTAGLSVFSRVGAIVTAPANAVAARLIIRGLAVSSVANQPELYFTHAQIAFARVNQTDLDTFVNGGVTTITGSAIKTGTLDASKITAGTITAQELGADSVTAAKIKAGEVVAGKLAADAVVADNIAANAVVAEKIATNAVTAQKIAAGAVTTEKLSVGSATNVIWNSCCSLATDGWAAGGLATVLAPAATTLPTWSLLGYGTGLIHHPGALGVAQYMWVEWWPQAGVPGVAVEPGQRYQASVLVQNHRCQATLEVMWVDGNAREISRVWTTIATETIGPNGHLPGYYHRLEVLGDAPPGTAFALLRFTGAGIGQPDPYLFFTQAMLGKTAKNATEVSAWTAGGVTEIAGGMIRARTIQADRIAANTIGASEINAHSVRAGILSVGAISAGEIAAGAIRANHLASETIITQAAQIGTAVIESAQIKDLSVDTLKVANGAITTFSSTTRYDGIGGGNVWVQGAILNVWVPQPRSGLLLCTFALGYVGGNKTHFSRLVLNGANVTGDQGGIGTPPNGAVSAGVTLAPGNNVITFDWYGQDAGIVLNIRSLTLFVSAR